MRPREGRGATAVRTALIAGGLVLLVAVVLVLAQSAPRSAGSEDIAAQNLVAELGPGERTCLRDARIPAGTARAFMVIGTFGVPGPRVDLVATDRTGRVVVRGGLEPGWRQGPILVPLGPVRETTGPVELCVVNRGQGRLALGGEPGSPEGRRLIVDYLRAGEETWFATAPRVVERYRYGKADLLGGGWTLWAALALVLVAWAAAARALLRAAPESP